MIAPADVVTRVNALPVGVSTGFAGGKRYVVTRSGFCAGRADKLVAEELGGSDYISLNIYRLARGTEIFPCEMPAEKVIRFIRAFVPDGQAGKERRTG